MSWDIIFFANFIKFYRWDYYCFNVTSFKLSNILIFVKKNQFLFLDIYIWSKSSAKAATSGWLFPYSDDSQKENTEMRVK